MNNTRIFKDSNSIKVEGRGVPKDPYVLRTTIDIPTPFSGSYNDLTDLPTLFSGSYTDLTDTPALFSGNYADLTGTPTLFSGSYGDLTGVPSTFEPSAHTHSASDINSGVLTAARIPTLAQSKVTNLVSDLASKLTASQGAAIADSVAADITTLVADFNSLLAVLRTAGIIAT